MNLAGSRDPVTRHAPHLHRWMCSAPPRLHLSAEDGLLGKTASPKPETRVQESARTELQVCVTQPVSVCVCPTKPKTKNKQKPKPTNKNLNQPTNKSLNQQTKT